MFTSLVDLITMAIFLSITPQVKEGFNAITRGDRKDISGYKNYLTSVSTITRNCMWWLNEMVPKLYKPDPMVYTAMLYKSLFMTQSHEEYFRFGDLTSLHPPPVTCLVVDMMDFHLRLTDRYSSNSLPRCQFNKRLF